MKLLNVKKKRDDDWGGGKKKAGSYSDVISLAENKEEKKQKDDVRKLMYVDSQQVKRRQTSNVQKMLNEISRRRLKDPGEIAGFFTSRGIKMYDIPKEMYIAIASARVSNTGSIVLTDSIANKPLIFRSYVRGFTTKVVTNDHLWLQLIFSRELEFMNPTTDDEKLLLSLVKKSQILGSTVSSGPFICDKGENIRKGYYQDFDGDFACIGMQLLNKNEIKDLITKKTKKYDFVYNNKNYTAIGTNNSCIIYTSETNDNDILERVENTKVFSAFGKFELGPKEIDFKSKSVRYLDFNMKPDNFCPAFLILNDNEEVNLLLKLTLNYNSVFNLMDEYYKKKSKVLYEQDFCYWDTFVQYFDFLFIYYLTSPVLSGVEKTNLKDWIVQYIDFKPTLLAWKQLQLNLEKICIDYYNSFMSKISYDKLNNLSKKIDLYIKNRNRLIAEGNFESLKKFMDGCPIFSYWMKNQFKDFGLLLADYIKEVLDSLLENEHTGIVSKLRELGISIYEHTYNPKMKDETSLFPILLSEGAFLGSLYDETNKDNPIAEIAKKINKKAIIKSVKESKAAKVLGNIINNVDKFQQKLVEDYIYSVMNEATNEDVNILSASFTNLIEENKNLKTALNDYVASAAVEGKLKKKAFFDFGKYGGKKIIDTYKLDKQKVENEREKERIDAKGDVIDAKMKLAGAGFGEAIEEEADENTLDWAANFFSNLSKDLNYDEGTKNYLATIVYLSSVYKEKTYDELLKTSMEDLLLGYKLNPSAIKYIILDHELPTSFDKIKTFKRTGNLPRGIIYNGSYALERDKRKGDDEKNLDKHPLTRGKQINVKQYQFRPTTVASKESPFVTGLDQPKEDVKEEEPKYQYSSKTYRKQSAAKRNRFKEKDEGGQSAIISAMEGLGYDTKEKGKASASRGQSKSRAMSRRGSQKSVVQLVKKK